MSKQHISSPKHCSIRLYNYDKIITRTFALMEKDLSQNNVELIKKFDRVLVNESLSDARRSKVLGTILSLSRMLNKDWIDASKEDMEELVYNFNKKFSKGGQETNTTADHKKILKNFYRWIKRGSRDQKQVGDPTETSWIRVRKPRENLTADMLITESEKNSLLKACGENLRDRAFVHTFSDLACRPGEILSRQIKHVKFDDRGAIIVVDGKTGPRPVRVIECVPDLASYFDKHPNNSDPEAPLWIAMDDKKYGEAWSYAAMRKRLQRICDVAQIHKRVWPNLFRHTGATRTGMFLTESLQKKRYGWSSGSKMPGRYEHMMNSDVEEAMFKHYGMSSSKGVDLVNKPRICKICDVPNSYDAKLCSKCGKPLSLKTAIEKEEQEQIEKKQLEEKIKILEEKQVKLENSQKEYEAIKPDLDKMVIQYFEDLGEDFFRKVFSKKLAKINL
ncbi:integrase family protein [Candidatus Nitrosopumilus koreensis AR1]|uniref:Integrase family protein n=1 Tax=Candidatus Nitrosopumilus koreensis AR1 TaxID=1229908 RepID=K0B4N3_9ARCH|nr:MULTISPECIES: site-specific integrase [Nitrosopumilus]AFS80379.1 integrase family protein [Candidatus Nitrosopumilus koreensis AR1]